MNPRCERCGGAVSWDREHPLDAPVLKCVSCGRKPGPPRPHEEPGVLPDRDYNRFAGVTDRLMVRGRPQG